jgi:hypothetical protein
MAIAVFPHGFFLFLLQLRTSVSPFGAISDRAVDISWDSGYRSQYVHDRNEGHTYVPKIFRSNRTKDMHVVNYSKN